MLKSNQTKKCHIDIIYVKTKTTHAVKYWLNPVQDLFKAFNSLVAALLAAVDYISKPELL